MQNFSISPKEMAASLWRNRSLIKALTQREVIGRYRGSVMGILWSFLNPVFMLLVFTFVFSVIFKARWSVGSDSKTEFALVLFAGLIVFNLFAECVNRAPGLILSNVNYVKKVVFPLEILPWVALGAGIAGCLFARCLPIYRSCHHRDDVSLAHFLPRQRATRRVPSPAAIQPPHPHRTGQRSVVLGQDARYNPAVSLSAGGRIHRLAGFSMVPEDTKRVCRCPLKPPTCLSYPQPPAPTILSAEQ